MTNHKAAFTTEGLHPSTPLVKYSLDEIEHSRLHNITECSNKTANVGTAACYNLSTLHTGTNSSGPDQ